MARVIGSPLNAFYEDGSEVCKGDLVYHILNATLHIVLRKIAPGGIERIQVCKWDDYDFVKGLKMKYVDSKGLRLLHRPDPVNTLLSSQDFKKDVSGYLLEHNYIGDDGEFLRLEGGCSDICTLRDIHNVIRKEMICERRPQEWDGRISAWDGVPAEW